MCSMVNIFCKIFLLPEDRKSIYQDYVFCSEKKIVFTT